MVDAEGAASVATQIVALKKRRQTIKGKLTRLFTGCRDPENSSADKRVHSDRADELLHEFEKVQDELEELIPQAELPEQEKLRYEFEQKHLAIKSLTLTAELEANQSTPVEGHAAGADMRTAVQSLMEHQATMSILIQNMASASLSNAQTPPITGEQPRQQTTRGDLRLPRIQIPEFDGQPLNWIRFRNLFESVVHGHSSISEAEKLEYLHTKLKGDALSLIKHLNPTNGNYVIAWELLKDKYDKSEKIKHVYLALLLEQQPVKGESTVELQRLYNNVNEAYNALKVLNEPVEHWNTVLVFLLEKKLDAKTVSLWYREKKQDEPATFLEFLKFVDKRIYELGSGQSSDRSVRVDKHVRVDKPVHNQTRSYATTSTKQCPGCDQNHQLYQCQRFKSMDTAERRNLVRSKKLCFNCLQSGHWVRDCASSSCQKCGDKHNTMLHPAQEKTIQSQGQSEQETVVNHHVMQQQKPYVLLPTAMVGVVTNSGEIQVCRALLDSGSQKTLISEACAQRLRLQRHQDRTVLFGVNASTGSQVKGKVKLVIRATVNEDTIETEALCLRNLTQFLPSQRVEDNKLQFFKHLKLADENYDCPAKIDIILGADVFMDCCLATNRITHPSGAPTAFNTIFGWVLMGNTNITSERHVMSCYVGEDLDHQLRRFWEIEDVSSQSSPLTPDEQAAEDHFIHHTSQADDGRFVVKLPFRNQTPCLGESRSNALKRLYAMERKFKLRPQLQEEYCKFMQQYLELGHMEAVKQTKSKPSYFLPHHAVFKESSTTTKLRVVFDASCKSSNGRALNEEMLVGAKQQDDIFDIMIKFRMFEIGFVGDIEKMYRQIWVHAEDRQWQRVLWRQNEREHVQEFQLKTVTYGTASAPFLATRTLTEIAMKNKVVAPVACDAIRQHFYVDDLMCCSPTAAQAIRLKDAITELLAAAGLQLRKWASNSNTFLETIKAEDREKAPDTVIDTSTTVNTLGLRWNTTNDWFKYSVVLSPVVHPTTKRTVLSDISKIYDPLGWLSPMVIKLKIFMQQLWLKGVGWDEPLDESLFNHWMEIRQDINTISKLHIPRWIGYDEHVQLQLHGFADASELAYAAAVYTRITQADGHVVVRLVAAKSRVAPVKQVTLPRLELCAAHLLVKLMTRIRRAFNIQQAELFGWSDSTVVLAWLSDHPRRWKSFIGNRTAYIMDIIPAQRWRHIRSQQNPADLATRGISPDMLIDNELWWHGPAALQMVPSLGDQFPAVSGDIDMEERHEKITHTITKKTKHLISQYSSFCRLKRVVAWLFRFAHNCIKHRAGIATINGFLSASELAYATNTVLKQAQAAVFKHELHTLTSGRQLPANHKLASTAPFVDDSGLLRVGGRLENSQMSHDTKHPIIMHKDHHVTRILIEEYHLKYFHAGIRLLHCLLSQRYWVPGLNHAIRRCIYKCPVCMRQRARPFKQKMGDLPSCRLETGLTFNNVGIDYAGPIQIRSWKGRGAKQYKSWIAVFVCMVTKALHIELVSELTTAAFLASLRRFCARRGKPSHIYSDNGTNLVGANNQLQDWFSFLKSDKAQEKLTAELANDEITWHFSPPAGPHFGGLWEAGVKSVKYHLKRVLGESAMTFEEMTTVLCQIEGCLNSRPLCLKTEGDMDPLTPAHFTILRPMTAVIDEDITHINANRLNRWQHVQRLTQQFWHRWSTEYVHQLQQRSKWATEQPNIKIDDVVLIKEDNLAPSKWCLGKVIATHPGKDGLVRVVTVKTTKGTLTRPIIKLCPLTVDL